MEARRQCRDSSAMPCRHGISGNSVAWRHSLFDLEVPYSHEAWRGRIRASAGVGASLSPEGVAAVVIAEHRCRRVASLALSIAVLATLAPSAAGASEAT